MNNDSAEWERTAKRNPFRLAGWWTGDLRSGRGLWRSRCSSLRWTGPG